MKLSKPAAPDTLLGAERRGFNRVRELREARALTQAELGEAAGITRQSVNAIETGRAVPGVDVALRLARALACAVETLFEARASDARFSAEAEGAALPGRVALSHISGRWVSYALDREGLAHSADGLATPLPAETNRPAQVEVELLRPGFEPRENLVLMGCAPALGLLADRLNVHSGAGRFLWLSRSSTAALSALGHARAHLAGVHLVDAKTGEANVPDVRRQAFSRPVVLVTLASWEVGFVLPPGNPKRVSRVSQLGRKGLRLVGREIGSGVRRLLESELKRAELPLHIARDTSLQASGHLDVARAIALGAADVGIATRDAAAALGLAFVPIAQERYDLVVPRDDLEDPRITRLFEVMTAAPFRRELTSLGYDVSQCGTTVAEVLAA
jgi:molybdate-binding protein/DNA-binding XRE family transcriptional regulator